MTTFALRTEAAFVFIVFLMAGDAGIRSHNLPGHRLRVAKLTSNSFMAAVELELGADVMIEIPDLPVTGIVAFLALRAESASMRVIVLMAGMAVGRGFLLVECSCVAAFASGCPMGAE